MKTKPKKIAVKKERDQVPIVVWVGRSFKAKIKMIAHNEEKSLSALIRDALTEAVV